MANDLPEDDFESTGLDVHVLERLAPLVGRIVLSFTLVDLSSLTLFAGLPPTHRDLSRDAKRMPFDDRLKALRKATRELSVFQPHAILMQEALGKAARYSKIRNVVCHWTLSRYETTPREAVLYTKTHFGEGADPMVTFEHKLLSLLALTAAPELGHSAAEAFYNVLFRLEGYEPSTDGRSIAGID